MFKKIQWTFSIYFLNFNYLVSLQYQYIWPGTVGTVSGCVKAIQYTCHKLALNSLTIPATAPCKLNTCSAVGKRSCGHTGQDT